MENLGENEVMTMEETGAENEVINLEELGENEVTLCELKVDIENVSVWGCPGSKCTKQVSFNFQNACRASVLSK